jgi:putative ABC transport system permease protein
MARNKRFTIVAILALALGIGPNVAMFSIIWATFLARLPYPDEKHMILVWNHYNGERIPTSADDYAQYVAQCRSFERLDYQAWSILHLTNADHSEDSIAGLRVTPGFITKTIGFPMLLGRDFLPDEGKPGNDHYVILDRGLWETRYHSDPHILGRAITIDDEPYTVWGGGATGATRRGEEFQRAAGSESRSTRGLFWSSIWKAEAWRDRRAGAG